MLFMSDSVQSNVTGRCETVAAVHRPCSVDEVRELVLGAASRKVALYPVSTGRNWGYGSASPPVRGCELLDLSRMNAILNAEEISASNPVAVIQPGVTQGQLADFLAEHCPSLTFNVTGSARETSILGNALDRGVGYLGPRRDDLFGLEIVTGTGQVLQTGFRRLGENSPLAHCHPNGLGPMLDGLFFQSNFGVVTSACFRLIPRRPRQVAISLVLRRAEDLPQFLDILAALKREQVLTGVTHVGNRARTRVSLMHGVVQYLTAHSRLTGDALLTEAKRIGALVAPSDWTGLGGISGTSRQVRAAFHEINRRLSGVAKIRAIDEAKLSLGYRILHALRALPWARAQAGAIAAIKPLHGLALGRPTDAAVDNLLWRFGRQELSAERLDESNCGLLFISPALPMNGKFVADVMRGMERIAADHGHELFTTINIETDSSMVAVVNLLFDRADPTAAARAHGCASALYDNIRSRGLEVYRARADMMKAIVDPGADYWRVLQDLKAVLDPASVIAPGRYGLTT